MNSGSRTAFGLASFFTVVWWSAIFAYGLTDWIESTNNNMDYRIMNSHTRSRTCMRNILLGLELHTRDCESCGAAIDYIRWLSSPGWWGFSLLPTVLASTFRLKEAVHLAEYFNETFPVSYMLNRCVRSFPPLEKLLEHRNARDMCTNMRPLAHEN